MMPEWDFHESDQPSAREEKKALREVGKILSSQYPNPERKGCPGSQALKDAAYQRPKTNLNEVLGHTMQCSPCFVESQRYVRQYQRRRLLFRTLLPIAASILIVAATYFYWVGRQGTKLPTHPQQTPAEIVSLLPTPNRTNVPPSHIVHAATIIIQGPIRGTTPQTPSRVTTLPRGIVDLTIQMPVGYQSGTFEVRISGKKNKIDQRIEALLEGGLARIQFRVDFSVFEPGDYQLVVAKPGESATYIVLLQVQ